MAGRRSTLLSLFIARGDPAQAVSTLDSVHADVKPQILLFFLNSLFPILKSRLKQNLLWFVILESGEENHEHGSPKSGQETVANDVESSDERPRLWSPGEEFSSLRVVDQVLDSLPSVPFHRFEGCGPQNRRFLIRHLTTILILGFLSGFSMISSNMDSSTTKASNRPPQNASS